MKHVTVNALCFTEVMFPGGRFLKQPLCTFCSDSLHASLRMATLLSSKVRQIIISICEKPTLSFLAAVNAQRVFDKE